VAVLVVAVAVATGCGADNDADPAAAATTDPPADATTAPGAGEAGDTDADGASESAAPRPAVTEPELRAELVELLDADQAERTGEVTANNDRARTERLKEIIDEYGWPTVAQVGAEGATAAWAIAQHSDHDVEFQEQALELMTAAVAAGEADPSQLAFLVDRVAVNQGRPQTYGSQMGCVDGTAVPAPIGDEDKVDQRRADIGLDPLADYLAQFAEACASGQ
jgi:hypothetical protein